jgi:hypothetical protein
MDEVPTEEDGTRIDAQLIIDVFITPDEGDYSASVVLIDGATSVELWGIEYRYSGGAMRNADRTLARQLSDSAIAFATRSPESP